MDTETLEKLKYGEIMSVCRMLDAHNRAISGSCLSDYGRALSFKELWPRLFKSKSRKFEDIVKLPANIEPPAYVSMSNFDNTRYDMYTHKEKQLTGGVPISYLNAIIDDKIDARKLDKPFCEKLADGTYLSSNKVEIHKYNSYGEPIAPPSELDFLKDTEFVDAVDGWYLTDTMLYYDELNGASHSVSGVRLLRCVTAYASVAVVHSDGKYSFYDSRHSGYYGTLDDVYRYSKLSLDNYDKLIPKTYQQDAVDTLNIDNIIYVNKEDDKHYLRGTNAAVKIGKECGTYIINRSTSKYSVCIMSSMTLILTNSQYSEYEGHVVKFHEDGDELIAVPNDYPLLQWTPEKQKELSSKCKVGRSTILQSGLDTATTLNELFLQLEVYELMKRSMTLTLKELVDEFANNGEPKFLADHVKLLAAWINGGGKTISVDLRSLDWKKY